MYHEGIELEKDHEAALGWYRRAAAQGVAGAQFMLARMYFEGEGTPKDFAQAHLWFSLAAANEVEKAAKLRDKAAKKLSPEELAASEAAVREWRPAAEEQP